MIPKSFYEEWKPVAGDMVFIRRNHATKGHENNPCVAVNCVMENGRLYDVGESGDTGAYFKTDLLPVDVEIPWEAMVASIDFISPLPPGIKIVCKFKGHYFNTLLTTANSVNWNSCDKSCGDGYGNLESFKIPSSQFESVEPLPDYTATNEYEPPKPLEVSADAVVVKQVQAYHIRKESDDELTEAFCVDVDSNGVVHVLACASWDSIEVDSEYLNGFIKVLRTIKESM